MRTAPRCWLLQTTLRKKVCGQVAANETLPETKTPILIFIFSSSEFRQKYCEYKTIINVKSGKPTKP